MKLVQVQKGMVQTAFEKNPRRNLFKKCNAIQYPKTSTMQEILRYSARPQSMYKHVRYDGDYAIYAEH